ncbi:MAG: 50S ribosomal protein L17 [Candidatus Jorgensenbacteria bacterium]|nr:50S ribosomal protein L17 [Candidatus Jorgensenbacteria bacterium]
MRHLARGKKFGLKRGPRRAFMRILVNNLVSHGKITTTETRAKEIRKFAERMVTYGKQKNLAGLRLLLQHLPKSAAYKVYNEIAPRYAERKGGYTRIIKQAKPRVHDASKMATIQFV